MIGPSQRYGPYARDGIKPTASAPGSLPLLLLLVLKAAAMSGPVSAAPSDGPPYHIVVPRWAVTAGDRVELRVLPPPAEGVRVRWSVLSGEMAIALEPPIYRAPYLIQPGALPAKVTVALSGPGMKTSVTTEIELLPGSVPGASDCLGPGQSFSTVMAGIEPDYTFADELPELIQRVEPDYPRSAFARGVEDTFIVSALVCRTGRVLDAFVPPAYRDIRDEQPIERDPKLVEAGLAAVRQYLFKPAIAAGYPIASWVQIPIAFRR